MGGLWNRKPRHFSSPSANRAIVNARFWARSRHFKLSRARSCSILFWRRSLNGAFASCTGHEAIAYLDRVLFHSGHAVREALAVASRAHLSDRRQGTVGHAASGLVAALARERRCAFKRGPRFRLPPIRRWPIIKRLDRPGGIRPMSLSTQSLSPNLPPDTQREMLRRMLTIRRFEDRASADYLAGKIYAVVHCSIGAEAGAGAACLAPPRPPRQSHHPPQPPRVHSTGEP